MTTTKFFKNSKAISFFILSLSIFTYQNLLGPTFSTLLTGLWQAWVAIPSFLGIGLGLWLSLSVLKKVTSLEKVERFGYHGICYVFISIFVTLAVISKRIDKELLAAVDNKTVYIESLMFQVMQGYVPLLLSLISIPFVFFGLILGAQFSKSVTAINAYRFEIIGLLIGSLICIGLLESWSWATVVIAIVVLNFLSVVFFEFSKSFNLVTTIKNVFIPLIALALFCGFSSQWILQRDLHLVHRDFRQNASIEMLETRWKSFAKVQLLEATYTNNFKRRYVAIGDGTGIAKYMSYDGISSPSKHTLTTDLAAISYPKKVAILFAGTGVEAISLHQTLGHHVETYSVEINSAITDIVAKFEGRNYLEFFKTYPSFLIQSDNRKFLETTKENFDSIIYSWSGATVANFSGAILHTTQYSFTKEALSAAVGHLNKDGRMIIMGGNKLNIINSLKRIESENKISDLKNKIILFAKQSDPDWKVSWDDFILIYKNGDWDDHEIGPIEAIANGWNYKLVVKPGVDTTSDKIFQKTLQAQDVGAESETLWHLFGTKPQVADDNYPFVYRNQPSIFNQGLNEWKSRLASTLTAINLQTFDGIIWVGLVTLILLVFSAFKKDISLSSDFFHFMGWAPLSAVALLFFLYKAILYFGEPTIAFLVVQTATQLGSLLGLQMAIKNKKPKLSLYCLSLGLILLIGAGVSLSNESVSSFIFNLNLYIAGLLFGCVIVLISFTFSFYFMNQFFTETNHEKKFGLFWTFETLFCGVASLMGAFLIEEQGLRIFMAAFICMSFVLMAAKWKKLLC